VERVTTLASPVRQSLTLNRDSLAAGFFVLLGAIDIAIFGLFAHTGHATFQLSISGSGTQIPNIKVPAALVSYVVGGITVVIGFWRGIAQPSPRLKRVAIGAVLTFFLIALLCWADAGNSTGVNLISLIVHLIDSARLRRAGRLHVRAVRRDQHRDRRAAAGRGVRRRDHGQRGWLAVDRADFQLGRGRPARPAARGVRDHLPG
jgi:hypothetical protein